MNINGIPEKELLRLSIIADEIIKDNFLIHYNYQQINTIIEKSYKLDRHELSYVLFRINKKLNTKKVINHCQTRLSI